MAEGDPRKAGRWESPRGIVRSGGPEVPRQGPVLPLFLSRTPLRRGHGERRGE